VKSFSVMWVRSTETNTGLGIFKMSLSFESGILGAGIREIVIFSLKELVG